MSRRKRSNSSNDHSKPIYDYSSKQLRRKKPIDYNLLKDIYPLTDNQEKIFKSFDEDKNVIACGLAGTGKTFVVLYNALCDVLSERTPYEKIYLVRSLVPTREIGFLPGSHDDKADLYQIPYKNMVKLMFDLTDEPSLEMLYGNLKTQGTLSFWSTSFIRGITLDNCIIIVDEMQNLSSHELDSIITRVGNNSKIMFCGDTNQSDLIKQTERNGINLFLKIIKEMPSFDFVEFGINDIVRSGLVKQYLTKKYELKIDI